jgi:FtsP/CotA-like multicopper oxidase with cupredoxin domain
VRPVTVDEFRIGTAETYDVIVQPREARPYTIFAQVEDRTGFARGTLAPRPGMTAAIPPMDPRPMRSMKDMGMEQGSMGGMQTDQGSMPGMSRGSPGRMQMGQGSMPRTSHGSPGGMQQMNHGSMPGMSQPAPGGIQPMNRGSMPGMNHGATGGTPAMTNMASQSAAVDLEGKVGVDNRRDDADRALE